MLLTAANGHVGVLRATLDRSTRVAILVPGSVVLMYCNSSAAEATGHSTVNHKPYYGQRHSALLSSCLQRDAHAHHIAVSACGSMLPETLSTHSTPQLLGPRVLADPSLNPRAHRHARDTPNTTHAPAVMRTFCARRWAPLLHTLP